MADSLRSKALHAVSWTFLEAVGVRGTQFIVGIVLARLLLPEQFGLIGMLTVFMAVAQSLLDSGFGAALIQKRDVARVDACSIFYFNIIVGIAAAGLLCLAAPWIAAFYHQPILTPLTRAMSAVIVVNSFALVQNTILTKELNFRAMTKVSLIGSTLSGIGGIAAAVAGCGVWSLVIQQVSSAFLHTLLLWLVSPWRPAWIFSRKSLQGMFGFGSRVMASGLLSTIFANIYWLIIGKLFSAADLGYFTRAQKMQELPTLTLSWMVGRVTFPVFSSIQDDRVRVKRGLRKVLTSLAFVSFPITIGILVTARPLVIVLLTEKWAPCVPYLRLLCLAGLLFPMNWFNMNVLYAIGRSDLCFRLEVIKKTLIVISIAILWRWGIEALIWGQVVVSILSYAFNSYYNGILIGYPVWEQVRDLVPYMMPTAVMGLGVYLMGQVPWPSDLLLLLMQMLTGVALCLGISRLLRLPEFLEMWQTGWQKLSSLKVSTA
jgi:teichuronic acid exporter